MATITKFLILYVAVICPSVFSTLNNLNEQEHWIRKLHHNSSTFVELTPGYELSFETTENSVTFHAIVETTGYIGFGISDSGTMPGADIFIGGLLDGSLESYSGDYYAEQNGAPTLDTVQNWDLLGVSQNEDRTTVTFKRLFDTGDPQDNVIRAGEITVIWAVASSDHIQYHTRRGSARLTIMEFDPTEPTTEHYETTTTEYYECSSSKPCPSGMFCDYNYSPKQAYQKVDYGFCRCIDDVYSRKTYDLGTSYCSLIPGAACLLNPNDPDFQPCIQWSSCVAKNSTHGRCQCQVGFLREETGNCVAGFGSACGGQDRIQCSEEQFLDCRDERCVCSSPTLQYEFGNRDGCVAPVGEPCNVGTRHENRVQCGQGLNCVELSIGSGDYFCQTQEKEL